jgi:hypothetical protein
MPEAKFRAHTKTNEERVFLILKTSIWYIDNIKRLILYIIVELNIKTSFSVYMYLWSSLYFITESYASATEYDDTSSQNSKTESSW